MKKTTPEMVNRKKHLTVICAIALLTTVIATSALTTGCKKKEQPAEDTTPVVTEAVTEPVETEPVEEDVEPSYAHGEAFNFVKKDMGEKPEFIDPLTGLAATKDLSNTRPVGIMINNIEHSWPQVGISEADILYECLAEGGITRLLMVTRDYESLETIGSIRSSREYYIDFAKNHDAIYVHAGGSDEAYSQISQRKIDHLDGVRADAISGKNMASVVFYRDPERLKTFALEHTMVTTGERIAEGIKQMGYRTELAEGFEEPVKPIDWGWSVELSGEGATHVKIPYRSNRVSEYEYDETTGKYLRYQVYHAHHIDGANNEHLAFENIIILNMPHVSTGDSKGHIAVTTTGTGTGWYITGGKYIPVEWTKNSQDEAMTLCDTEGNPLVVNQGKTMINIVEDAVFSAITFN